MTTQFPFLTHWSENIQKDAPLQVFTENLLTHQCALLWLTPLITHTNDPQSVKRGVVKCLYDRLKNIITKPSVISEEKKHLAAALVSNGYPYSFVTDMMQHL